jgi:hypothetical protein
MPQGLRGHSIIVRHHVPCARSAETGRDPHMCANRSGSLTRLPVQRVLREFGRGRVSNDTGDEFDQGGAGANEKRLRCRFDYEGRRRGAREKLFRFEAAVCYRDALPRILLNGDLSAL